MDKLKKMSLNQIIEKYGYEVAITNIYVLMLENEHIIEELKQIICDKDDKITEMRLIINGLNDYIDKLTE